MARQGTQVQPVARHGALRRRSSLRAFLVFLTAFFAVITISVASVALIAVWQFQDGLDVVDIGDGEDVAAPRVGAYPGGFNVLIVGSDTRVDQGGLGGADHGATLNDVNILLHVSADHTRAIAVSIPRDLVVPFPACVSDTGEVSPSSDAEPINEALNRGGLPCAVNVVEDLTGLEIQFAGLVTFQGVVGMSNAVGGVPVCVTAPIDDPLSGLVIDEAGEHVLSGEDALAFLRTRHGVGDGSDLGRISSQQVFLSALVRKLKSSETLSNPVRLYELAQVVRDNMRLSSSMASLDTLVALAMALKDIELENVLFVQYPSFVRTTDPWAGKLAPEDAVASALFSAIAADSPFQLGEQAERPGAAPDPAATPTPDPSDPEDPDGSDADGGDPTATPDPTGTASPEPGTPTIEGLPGQTAAERTCSVASGF